MTDKLKLLVAGLLAMAGIAGFYMMADSPMVLRLLSILVGFALAVGVAMLSEPGRQFRGFAQDSIAEARKVVWPTRKETLQTTGIVILFVIVMAIFLWAVDGLLFWLVKLLMGRSD